MGKHVPHRSFLCHDNDANHTHLAVCCALLVSTQVELLASDVKEHQNEITNTEEIVEIELDVLRNRCV